jgi:hypothetical protein
MVASWVAVMATSLALIVGPGQTPAQAKSGDLDPTFGAGGKVTTDFTGSGADDRVNGLAVQADGSLVAAGVAGRGGRTSDFALARYRAR